MLVVEVVVVDGADGACWCQVVDCELTIPLSVKVTVKST
jgi:hypothetical protein